MIESFSCPALDLSEFRSVVHGCKVFEGYYMGKSPVILRNLPASAKREDFYRKTMESHLLDQVGNFSVKLSTANAQTGRIWVEGSFSEHADKLLKPMDANIVYGNETFYIFGSALGPEWDAFLEEYQQPPFPSESMLNMMPDNSSSLCDSLHLRPSSTSFGAAGKFSGVPFHFHGPGFLEVIHGRKLFLIYPHEKDIASFDPNRTSFSWFNTVYPTLPDSERPIVCDLKSGDVLYFPNKVLHATVNIAMYNVFVATFS